MIFKFRAPSLLCLSLTKVSIILWDSHDTVNLIKKSDPTHHDHWRELEESLMKKLKKLRVPLEARLFISTRITYLGEEIIQWLLFHRTSLAPFLRLESYFLSKYTKKIRWTSRGTLDKRFMMSMIVKDARISCRQRFDLACYYNLTEDISDLWNEIRPAETTTDYLKRVRREESKLVSYWIHCLEGELHTLDEEVKSFYGEVTPYLFVFLEVSSEGTTDTMTYFWDKLTAKERGIGLSHKLGRRGNLSPKCIVPFLTTKLTFSEQLQYFCSTNQQDLFALLEWPFQDMFLNAMLYAEDDMSPYLLYRLLLRLVDYIKRYPNDGRYRYFFQYCWTEMPVSAKTGILESPNHLCHLLNTLTTLSNSKFAKMVVCDVSLTGKNTMALKHSKYKNIFRAVIKSKMWDLMPHYLTTFLPTLNLAEKIYRELHLPISLKGSQLDRQIWCKYGKFQFLKHINRLVAIERPGIPTDPLDQIRPLWWEDG